MTARSACEIRRLLDEAPFVGALARALAGPEADEVVQGTWLRAIQEDTGEVRRPREWLATVVRGVAHNLRRGRARQRAHERAAARDHAVPSSAELMLRQERRGELTRAVEALPTTLRTVVLLRYFEDLPPRVIARHLDLPVTTVTSRLRTALATLRHRLDRRHGDQRTWLGPLVSTQAATLATETLAMTAKGKIAAALGVLALAALTLWIVGSPGVVPPSKPGEPGQPTPLVAEENERQAPSESAGARTALEVPTPRDQITTGTLIVRAFYGEDDTPIPDLLIFAQQPGQDRWRARRVRTDEHGTARLEGLTAGKWHVANSRSFNVTASADLAAGDETELRLELPAGLTLAGLVVDAEGVAVAGAEVYLGFPISVDPERAAITGPDGRFTLRACSSHCILGARAAGYAPSATQLVSQETGRAEVRLELPAAGGLVDGSVFGPDGEPVSGAVVLVGANLPSQTRMAGGRGEPLPAQTHTGVDGRFYTVGLAAGEHPVRVRADGFAPWAGSCRVQAHVTTSLLVTLDRGLSCTGVVVDRDDVPVPGVWVYAGDTREFTHQRALSAPDGTFHFESLAPGEVELRARHDRGRARETVRGAGGETVSCTLRLDPGLQLRGRVLTTTGDPVPSAAVDVRADRTDEAPYWSSLEHTGADGSFTINNCPADRLLTVRVRSPRVRDLRLDNVTPTSIPLVIRAVAALPPSARVVGTLVDPHGRPVPHAKVLGFGPEGLGVGATTETSATGSFDLGPLVPGRWLVRIDAEGFPEVKTAWRTLSENDAWDLGVIQLAIGGTVRVRITGATELEPQLTIADPTFSHFASVRGLGDERLSKPVVPGSYYVSLRGRGVAAQLVPVEVSAGEETEVEVRVHPGVRQRLEFDTPTPLQERRIVILRDGASVVEATDRATASRPIPTAWERWLAPGDYTLVATGDGATVRVPFTVRGDSTDVVRVSWR